MQQHLYPGTTYAHISGGEPLSILDLSHEELVAFHRAHYHPRNARIVTYGNMELPRILEQLDAALERKLAELEPTGTWQPPDVGQLQRFAKPLRRVVPCPVEPGTVPSARHRKFLSRR